jgi:hypothetical protein
MFRDRKILFSRDELCEAPPKKEEGLWMIVENRGFSQGNS